MFSPILLDYYIYAFGITYMLSVLFFLSLSLMKYFLSFILFFITNIILAQTDSLAALDPPLTIAEEMPSFPGGEEAMMKFLQSNLKYSEAEKIANVSGKCYLTFIIEKNGSISNTRILKGVTNGPGCDKEAMRVVALMPNWTPGKQNGQAVRVQFNLPIKFTLRTNAELEKGDTIYFDDAWEKCVKKNAKYYRIATKQEGGFLVKDCWIKNNFPQMIAICDTLEPLNKNGKAIFYYETGIKSSEGTFVHNKRVGIYTRWTADGKDSAITECFADCKYKNIRIGSIPTLNDQYDVLYTTETMPQYIGGDNAMMYFIQKNIKYPEFEKEHNISGTCYVTFVIEKDGALTDIRILKGIKNGANCDAEAMRAISTMPNWKPGLLFGQYVRVQFNLPVKFTLR
jgi:TonB family protein